MPDAAVFPSGFQHTIDHIRGAGMTLGMYIARGNQTCQGRPGTLYHEAQDAAQFAAWGVSYLKLDSCDGYGGRTAWAEYSLIADALRAASTAPPYVEVCENFPWLANNVTLPPGDASYGNSAYTLGNWLSDGLPVDTIANALLVEWENTGDSWASTLGNFDAQFFLTSRLLAFPGVASHMDMLTVCMSAAQSVAQYQAQLSLWSIMGSPLILGNDFSRTDEACVAAVLVNGSEVIAVDQDGLLAPSYKVLDTVVSLGASVAVAGRALPGGGGPVSVWWQVVTRRLESGELSVVVLCREAPMTAAALVRAALRCDAGTAAGSEAAEVCASAAKERPLAAPVVVTLGAHARHEVVVRDWRDAPQYLFNASLPLLGIPSSASVAVRNLWLHADVGPAQVAIPLLITPMSVAHINVRLL